MSGKTPDKDKKVGQNVGQNVAQNRAQKCQRRTKRKGVYFRVIARIHSGFQPRYSTASRTLKTSGPSRHFRSHVPARWMDPATPGLDYAHMS